MSRGGLRARQRTRSWVPPAVFALVAGVYVWQLFMPEPSLQWGAGDESCCHVPTIVAFQERGLEAVRDYPSATTPVYHLLMAAVYGRVDDLWLRLAWGAVTLAAGWLIYLLVRDVDRSPVQRQAALAVALAFLLSPTIRASAVYFVTDGLPLHLAIVAMAFLRRERGESASAVWAGLAVLAAHLSFYTRQYYLWAPLYVTYRVFVGRSRRFQTATLAGSAALFLPALALFWIWGGVTPPSVWDYHTDPTVAVSLPTALGFLALYSLPALWLVARDTITDARARGWMQAGRTPLVAVGGLVMYVTAFLAAGFEAPGGGGILGQLSGLLFGRFGDVVFLAVSYCGLAVLVRWLVADGRRQLWWLVFLLPFVASGSLLQRYFEPVIIVFLFLVARPSDARRIMESRLVWFYPAFTLAYAVGRVLYFG